MRFSVFTTIMALALTLTSATPTRNHYGCDVSHDVLDLPPTQSNISIPNETRPKYITLAVGTQNYTCTNSGTYSAAGAVSILVDISCLYKSDPKLFEDVQNTAYNLFSRSGNGMPTLNQVEALIGHRPYILGNHYFIPWDGAIAPYFDFRSQEGGDEAYMVGQLVGGITSPEGSQNIDWLQLASIDGELAKYVFRVDTQGGQPPDSCDKEGHNITVPYTAKYWFFK
ncbi:unnamed protein product [Rhizoctonia solani]|uniref:Malate dehydrogenase n=1 Tax=Rhizoctonia solani TaxID=456999 RepID=A0A8H3GRE5_9AGAM|nr:unnamed protein product [Rhizoctonia solani]CAE6491179.1 unnamed protein product [Rhizoctonia solani]